MASSLKTGWGQCFTWPHQSPIHFWKSIRNRVLPSLVRSFYLMFLFERQRERETDGFPSAGVLLKWPNQPGLGQTPNPRPPCGQRGLCEHSPALSSLHLQDAMIWNRTVIWTHVLQREIRVSQLASELLCQTSTPQCFFFFSFSLHFLALSRHHSTTNRKHPVLYKTRSHLLLRVLTLLLSLRQGNAAQKASTEELHPKPSLSEPISNFHYLKHWIMVCRMLMKDIEVKFKLKGIENVENILGRKKHTVSWPSITMGSLSADSPKHGSKKKKSSVLHICRCVFLVIIP